MKSVLPMVMIGTLLLGGCASTPLTLNYAPSSTKSVDGELKVGDFEYLPAKNESDPVQPNQIRNTAMGNVIFEKNIDEYFETALFTESRFVGINVKNSNTIVSGQIREFLIDDLGYSIDWVLDVDYLVKREGDQEYCYSENHKIEKHTAKFGDVFGTLNEIMKLNIEEAFDDHEFVNCISVTTKS